MPQSAARRPAWHRRCSEATQAERSRGSTEIHLGPRTFSCQGDSNAQARSEIDSVHLVRRSHGDSGLCADPRRSGAGPHPRSRLKLPLGRGPSVSDGLGPTATPCGSDGSWHRQGDRWAWASGRWERPVPATLVGSTARYATGLSVVREQQNCAWRYDPRTGRPSNSSKAKTISNGRRNTVPAVIGGTTDLLADLQRYLSGETAPATDVARAISAC